MSVRLDHAFASADPVGNGFSVTKVFTIFEIGLIPKPVISNIGPIVVGGIRFGDVDHELRPIFRGRWLLFVRHLRTSLRETDIEILTGAFTLADFTVSITIGDHQPPDNTIGPISDTPVHIIPC